MRFNLQHIKLTRILLVFILILTAQSGHSQDTLHLKNKDVRIYFEAARAHRNRDETDLALEALEKAAEVAEANADVKALVDCYHKFALVYLKLKKEETTYFYWDRAKALLKDIEYPYGHAMQKYIEAILLFHDDKNFQAIFMLNEAKQLNNDRNFFNNILLAEGNIYLKLEKFDSAAKNFNSLIVNTDIYESDYLATRAHLGLAQLHFQTEKFNEAAVNAENALKLAKKNNFFKEIWEANEMLTNTYEQLALYPKSLEHNKNLLHIRDSLFNIAKMKTEAKTAEKIQFDFMSDEIKRQEAKIEELNESKNKSDITAILTSALLTIITLLAVSLFRNNQIKLKTNELLQTKNNELKAARDAAVTAMEAKTNFLSTVSHELRTPLYAVTGLTHLLLEENPSKNQKEHLKALKFSGDYLLNFINDILQINKIDADKLEPLNVQFNLKKVLQEVIDSLKQSAQNNKTELILDYDPEIPYHILSDPLKLSQVFLNLVGNALKFTKNGEVRVIAKLLKKDDEDITLYFEVKDTGIGIAKEQQENIFDGFEQGSIQINREYGGTGLGLTIVKSLLGLFGSKIQLQSELGVGSSFFFELEAKSKESLVDDIPFAITEQEYDFKGLNILIVEDNKINQVITKKMLSKKEITSDIANNGAEAIDLARENYYDAILMDIHMPGIGGEEATVEIRKFDIVTPIIALTAISLDDSLESFYAAGCNDVITKPFKPEVFYQKIGENIFNRKELKNSIT
ncbi:tetratricopeptide repeat-containing hybrid sensor histidine kinase/response regulator [Zobellia uliginosa]|uniref:tetratricopeptide repeat-containing hybrid sensor histidine kinase/response regulator n=1 Tax=Zobellia uliginosa TaxID=143224 RepID=UPI0026E1A251|nr:ATP-binding protein [Zobellia uliginosa]MDO6519250.1 ATP-binding protein [Zobellia uliginosa]